jgi:hypothetical protein
VTCSIETGALVVVRGPWIWVGVVLGILAGLLGAYVGLRSARASQPKSPRVWVAVATLVLTLGLGIVVLRIRPGSAYGLILFLPVIFLGHWFMRQVKVIRAARADESEGDRGRCHRT